MKNKKTKDDLLMETIRQRVMTKKAREESEKNGEEKKTITAAEVKEEKKQPVKGEFVKTDVDELYDIIIKSRGIRIDHAAKKFRAPEAKIEEWANILEENGLIEIHYPPFGKPMLVKKG